jgi:hypothetical protein
MFSETWPFIEKRMEIDTFLQIAFWAMLLKAIRQPPGTAKRV